MEVLWLVQNTTNLYKYTLMYRKDEGNTEDPFLGYIPWLPEPRPSSLRPGSWTGARPISCPRNTPCESTTSHQRYHDDAIVSPCHFVTCHCMSSCDPQDTGMVMTTILLQWVSSMQFDTFCKARLPISLIIQHRNVLLKVVVHTLIITIFCLFLL